MSVSRCSNTHPANLKGDLDLDRKRLELTMVVQKTRQRSSSSSNRIAGMNSDRPKEQITPALSKAFKDADMSWQRKPCNRIRTSDANLSANFPNSSVPTAKEIHTIRRRKKSRSQNKTLAKTPSKCNIHELAVSTKTETTQISSLCHDEIFWRRKINHSVRQRAAFCVSDDVTMDMNKNEGCKLIDMSAEMSHIPQGYVSISSTSQNSESGVGLLSSACSGKASFPTRRHASRTGELRKQIDEMQARDKPLRYNPSSPIMEPAGMQSPIKRTRSLQRKHSVEGVVEPWEEDIQQQTQLPKRTTKRGPAMRNILRNRRKLEHQFNQSEMFHNVLHKGTAPENPQRLNSLHLMETCTNTLSTTAQSPRSPHRGAACKGVPVVDNASSSSTSFSGKIQFHKILKTKQQSEVLVQIQQTRNKQLKAISATSARKGVPLSKHSPQPVEDTWHASHSLDNFLSDHGSLPSWEDKGMSSNGNPFCTVQPKLDQSLFQLKSEEQALDDSIIDDDGGNDSLVRLLKQTPANEDGEEHQHFMDSFIGSDWKDLPSAWENAMDDDASPTIRERKSPTISERKTSRILSLSMEDMRMGMEDDQIDDADGDMSLQNSLDELSDFRDGYTVKTMLEKHVRDFVMKDATGRPSIYSGPISTVSGMPHGEGRMEYPESNEVFSGRFLHGWWSGYGTCINNQTKEEYTGYFLEYVKHGHGVTNFPDGRTFDGWYQNGAMAEGKMTYQDRSTYVGTFEGDARHGRGSYMFANGSVFFGQFQDDRFHAGVLLLPNGSRFAGKWRNGLRHGYGIELRPDGSILREGRWQEGRFLFAPAL